jgi:DNA processing protein
MDALEAKLWLARAPKLTAEQLRGALAQLGTPAALVGARAAAIAPLGLDDATQAWLCAPQAAQIQADRRWLERAGARLIDCTEADYPPQLANTLGAPALLYVQGDAAALLSAQLAMVGSRNPSASGRQTATEFAAFFARAGLTITSGLALGIDAASHAGALAAHGRTVAVLGCGLDTIYPAEHATLAQRIAAHGALVSEFPPGTAPRRENFPRRNRIISGLSLGTLVVEAARHSGSLITARLAGEQGREVFAIPGSIHNPLARGCHQLIRQGAKLVESADDVLSELNINFQKQIVIGIPEPGVDAPAPAAALDKEYEILLDALSVEPVSIDILVARTGLPSQSVASMLLILELEGRVGPQSGGRYIRFK